MSKPFNLVIVFLLAALVLAGCINLGGTTPPATNTTNVTPTVTPPENTTPQKNDTTIIITPQENQTVEQNYTEPTPPPPQQPEGLNYTYDPNANFAIYFIYVGDQANKLQGDAILIRKGDLEVLVDAGPSQTSGNVVSFLNSRGVDDVDLLISTNADPYHYGGIQSVTSNFGVEEFWWSGKGFNDQTYLSIVNDTSQKVKRTRIVSRGFNATINGIKFTVLNPQEKPFNDVDNDAIALRIEDRNFSMVLLSGVLYGAQSEMLNHVKDSLKCNVMQAPFYGLGTGTSGIQNFLTSTKPGAVVISGGPDESAVSGGSRDPFRKLLKLYNITYYENYAGGTVRVSSDGKDYSVGYFNP